MWGFLLAVIASIRVIPSPFVPGILDLQRPTDDGWETYNNIALLVEANGVWNSAELNGTMEPGDNGWYFTLQNGARVRVSVETTGFREVTATATVLEGNVTKIALSNDYGLATKVRYVIGTETYDALAFPAPNDGHRVSGAFYPIPPTNLVLIGDVIQYQRAEAQEAFIEIRKTPWLPEQHDPGRQWIERAHLTRYSGGTWTFGYALHRTVIPMVGH